MTTEPDIVVQLRSIPFDDAILPGWVSQLIHQAATEIETLRRERDFFRQWAGGVTPGQSFEEIRSGAGRAPKRTEEKA